MQNLLFPSRQHAESRRKATSARRVLRPARSNLGGTDRTRTDVQTCVSTFDDSRSLSSSSCSAALPVLPAQSSVQAVQRDVTSISLRRIDRACYSIKTDMTYTVTHQTTHILSPGGPQNALDKSHTKPPARQAARRTGVLDRCRRAKDKPGGQPRRVAPLLERRLAPERRSQPCSERVGQTPLIRLQG